MHIAKEIKDGFQSQGLYYLWQLVPPVDFLLCHFSLPLKYYYRV